METAAEIAVVQAGIGAFLKLFADMITNTRTICEALSNGLESKKRKSKYERAERACSYLRTPRSIAELDRQITATPATRS